MEEQQPIPLRYHTNPDMFYREDGTLDEEPEESLEELEENYHQACEEYSKWRKDVYEKTMEPYRDPKTGKIDYDAIEKDNSPEGERAYQMGLADFNAFGAFDFLEYDIDLKIMHLNARNGKIPPESSVLQAKE